MIPLNQENMRQVLILAAAIVVGIIAVGMVGQYVTSQVQNETQRLAVEYQQAQKAKEQEYEKQMAALHQEMKKIEASAKKAAEDAARTAAQQARPVVVENKGPVKKPSLALKTPKGKRAVTVLIDSLGAVGGLLNPGDAVDVIAHLDVPVPRKAKKDTGKETITAMLFQNLLILAVNTNVEDVGTLYDQQQADKALKV
ncbi:MAG: hypothetical protein GX606_01445, partial [Elusimicrobia bacterium]|nr:hypothetical protein [Elusimicrobiota bacterium]